MKKSSRVNIFILITMAILFYGKLILNYLGVVGNIDAKTSILLNQIIFVLYPAIAYIFLTKSNIKEIIRIKGIEVKSLLIIFSIAVFTIPIINLLSSIISILSKNPEINVINSMRYDGFFVKLIIVAVIPAIVEEFLFRGVILTEYGNVKSIEAIIINGLLFGLFHNNLNQAVTGFLIGGILALVVLITDSVIYSIIMHFVINSFAVILSSITINGTPLSIKMDFKVFLILIVLSIISIIAIYFLFKKLLDMNRTLEKIDDFIEDEENFITPPLVSAIVFSLGYILYPKLIINLFFIIVVILTFGFSIMLNKIKSD